MLTVTRSEFKFNTFCKDVIARMATEHRVPAVAITFEYPGCIVVASGQSSWWFGAINANWTGDMMSRTGEYQDKSIDTLIPVSCDDASIVAGAIASAIFSDGVLAPLEPNMLPPRCTLCRCMASGRLFGFAVCGYHLRHGEDDPGCPTCTSTRQVDEATSAQLKGGA